METLGYVRRDLHALHDWCFHQFGMKQMSSSHFVFNRTHKWFKHEVILTKPAQIKSGNFDYRVTRLGNLIYPGWDCALLAYYRPGGCMKKHRDHPDFESLLVSVNIGQATLRIDNDKYDLQDGQVIKFNSHIPHELYPVTSDRWSLTFRRIRPQHLRF